MQARTVLLSAAMEDHPLVREQVRPNVEGGLNDRRSQACRSDRLPARSGDDRGVAEAVARGLPELGGTDRLRGPRPPAATRSWEAASDVGLELRTNVWLQSVASVPTPRARTLPLWTTQGVAQPPGFPQVRFVDCPVFGDLSPAQCRSVRQIDNILGSAGAPGRARVVVGLFCEGTLPSGSAAGP